MGLPGQDTAAAHGGLERGEREREMEPVARGGRHGRPPLRESWPAQGGGGFVLSDLAYLTSGRLAVLVASTVLMSFTITWGTREPVL